MVIHLKFLTKESPGGRSKNDINFAARDSIASRGIPNKKPWTKKFSKIDSWKYREMICKNQFYFFANGN